jgi:hypothetical protein
MDRTQVLRPLHLLAVVLVVEPIRLSPVVLVVVKRVFLIHLTVLLRL